MINDDAVDSRELSPPANGGSKSRKMRLQKSKTRQRSSNNGASFDDGGGDPAVVGSDEENDATSSDESSVTSSLVRKVKRRTHLSSTDHEIVRLIGQHLTNIGLKTSADVLMQEAGCRLDQPTAATFKKFVLGGDWSQAVKSKSILTHPYEILSFTSNAYQLDITFFLFPTMPG